MLRPLHDVPEGHDVLQELVPPRSSELAQTVGELDGESPYTSTQPSSLHDLADLLPFQHPDEELEDESLRKPPSLPGFAVGAA